MFTANAVQQARWQNFLNAFSLTSSLPDMMNVRYLVCIADQYMKDRESFGDKYVPVYNSPDGLALVLENRDVLSKGWLVDAVSVVSDPAKAFETLRGKDFNPRRMALVESPPPFKMAGPNSSPGARIGDVSITRYEDRHISMEGRIVKNALLILGEKYFRGWRATVDGRELSIHPVNQVLRGIYLTPGEHRVEFIFDPVPFKIGKFITLASFAVYVFFLGREVWIRKP
jgi:hypothetical protein